MTDDCTAKLDEVERLLNDPEVVMQPGRVWRLLDEIAAAEGVAQAAGVGCQAV